MAGIIIVHQRIMERHPEISEEDVIHAWKNTLRYVQRRRNGTDSFVAVGPDRQGRVIEMVGVFLSGGDWLIFHAMRPPTKNTLKELGLLL